MIEGKSRPDVRARGGRPGRTGQRNRWDVRARDGRIGLVRGVAREDGAEERDVELGPQQQQLRRVPAQCGADLEIVHVVKVCVAWIPKRKRVYPVSIAHLLLLAPSFPSTHVFFSRLLHADLHDTAGGGV